MKKYFLSLTALMFGIFLNAQVFEFIKEINQHNEGFYMQNPGVTSLVLFQNKIYFNGLDGSVSDFWVTDGSYEGTYSIIGGTSSVYPSGAYYDIHPPVVFGDKMIFRGLDSLLYGEPWISDGTPEGTHILKNIHPTIQSDPRNFTAFGDKVLFSARDAIFDYEPWISDGTEEGTVMLKNINPNSTSSPIDFCEFNGYVYFCADNNVNGKELWRTDGTEDGTEMVIDIWPGSGWSDPRKLTVYNGELFFTAETPEYGYELWKSDGTAEGTVLVKDINPGPENSDIDEFTQAGDILFFRARNESGQRQLWKTDGTTEGTVLVTDIGGDHNEYVYGLFPALGKIFFNANLNAEEGNELWVSDGTANGTHMVKDIFQNGGSAVSCSFELGGYLFFSAKESNDGIYDMWMTDGTEAGTHKVNHTPGIAGVTAFNPDDAVVNGGWAYFAGNFNEYGLELWRMKMDPLGVEEFSGSENKLWIYPNPVSDVLRISGEMKDSDEITVFSIDGKEIIRQNLNSDRHLDFSSAPAGVYIATFLRDSDIIGQQKLIKVN